MSIYVNKSKYIWKRIGLTYIGLCKWKDIIMSGVNRSNQMIIY